MGRGRAHLGFAHDFAVGPDPDDEDELFALGFLVVRVAHADVGEGGLDGYVENIYMDQV